MCLKLRASVTLDFTQVLGLCIEHAHDWAHKLSLQVSEEHQRNIAQNSSLIRTKIKYHKAHRYTPKIPNLYTIFPLWESSWEYSGFACDQNNHDL